ncbi:MAG TPA: hypothetical protein VN364_08440 [Bellilinea sp.]|nr:hypothetical protein [Bellilinea sp.]
MNPVTKIIDMTILSNSWFGAIRLIQGVFRTFVFFLKVFPMLPSRVIDWVTKEPLIEKVTYPSHTGLVSGEIYRPPGSGPPGYGGLPGISAIWR